MIQDSISWQISKRQRLNTMLQVSWWKMHFRAAMCNSNRKRVLLSYFRCFAGLEVSSLYLTH